MKKKLLGFFLLAALCAGLCMPMTAMADGHKVVALGADLSQEQINMVLRYFGIQNKSIDTIYVTNTDERNHLGGYIPLEQIGNRTISCAFVNPTTSGGIQVKTANMNYVTSKMIASTLSTAGVVNCEVLAAAPFEVSGTGALTGVMMAYENAVGLTLDPVKKDVATQELITTEQIASQVGQDTATQIINDIKIQIVEGKVTEPDRVESIVEETVNTMEIPNMTQASFDLLQDLAQRIAEQEYDYEEMKDTLNRIDESVSEIGSAVDGLASFAEDETEKAGKSKKKKSKKSKTTTVEEEITVEEMADSIFNMTDDQAFGEETVIDATSDEAMSGYTEELEEAGVDISQITGDDAPEPQPEAQESSQEEQPSIFDGDGFNWDDSFDGSEEGNAEEEAQEQPDPEIQVQEESAEDSIFGQQDEFVWNEEENAEENAEEIVVENNEDGSVQEDAGDEGSAEEYYEEEYSDGADQSDEIVIEENVEENAGTGEESYVEEQPEMAEVVDEMGQDVPEEPEAAAANLEITKSVLVAAESDDTQNAAGSGIIKYSVNAPGLVAVSGSVTVYDANMNQITSVDLTDASQVSARVMSGEDLLNNMWDESEDGTTFYINLNNHFDRNSVYTVSLSGILAQAQSADTADGAPTCEVNENVQINTGEFGVNMNVSSINDLRSGAALSGRLVYDPESAVYAEIINYDGSCVSFDTTTFDLASGADAFNMSLYSPGTTQVVIDFYNQEGYAGSCTYYVNILA